MTEEVRKHIDMTLEINTYLMYNHIKAHSSIITLCARDVKKEFGKLCQELKDVSSLKGFVKQFKKGHFENIIKLSGNTF